MNLSQKKIYLLLGAVLLIGLAVYYFNINYLNSKENASATEEPEVSRVTNTISIGYVNDDAVKQIKIFQPQADYIAAKLSTNETIYEGKVIIVKSMENMTDLLKEQKVDLYMESPYTASLVAIRSGSVPFLRRWKDGVEKYHSIFIVKNGSSIKTLDDFIGKTIVFEDPGSTSGYFLPKAYLMKKGYKLSELKGENNISYIFSGEGENTPLWVTEGKADAGAISNIDFEKYPQSLKDKLKIIERTFDVPRHVVSHRSGLDLVLVKKIKQILLDMDKDPQGTEILKNFQNTTKYDEISRDDLSNTSRMVELIE